MSKKILVLMLVLSLVFLTSCGKNKKNTAEAEATTTAAATEETLYGLEDNPFEEGWEPTDEPNSQTPDSSAPNEKPGRPAGMPADAPITEYEKFQTMSAEEQMEFMNSFESVEDYFAWYNAAKEEYEALIPVIIVGDEPIDMSSLFEESSK